MTVNQKLSQIIQRLERIESALQKSASNQIAAPCCQPINDPVTGNPIPILPPTPDDVLPEIDLACARMYALIKRKVEVWNSVLLGPELPWVFAGGAGLYHALLAGLGQWTAAYMSQARLAELYSALVSLGEYFQIEGVDYCAAAREAFDHQDVLAIPQAVWDKVHPLDRAVFLVYWRLTGGLQGYENVDPDYEAPLGCCLPETFTLTPVVRTFACGSGSYDLDVIGESNPLGAARQVIVNRAGIPHALRAALAGFWVRSVEPPGRFSLEYWYAEAVTNDGCRYLRPGDGGTHAPDGDMPNMAWRLVLPTGSQYIVWRNRAAFEGVYIEVSRTEPPGWNGIDTI